MVRLYRPSPLPSPRQSALRAHRTSPHVTPTFELVVREHGPLIRRIARSYESNARSWTKSSRTSLSRFGKRYRGFAATPRTHIRRPGCAQSCDYTCREGNAATAFRRARRSVAGPGHDADQAAEHDQARRRLENAVARLPLGQRLVVSLALEGFSPEEIANVLGLGVSAASVRLHRAKAALQELLKEERR